MTVLLMLPSLRDKNKPNMDNGNKVLQREAQCQYINNTPELGFNDSEN